MKCQVRFQEAFLRIYLLGERNGENIKTESDLMQTNAGRIKCGYIVGRCYMVTAGSSSKEKNGE